MFLLNRIKLETVKDKYLLLLLKSWFNIIPNEHDSNHKLLESTSRMLNNLEISKIMTFEFDFNFSRNPVQISQRINGGKVIYHSQGYSRVSHKRCNYAVKLRDNNNLFVFGFIKYFIKINNIILVAVTKLKIIGNIIDKIGGRTSNALIGLKNSGVFNQFFSDVKEIKDELFFFDSSKLISKCILLKTNKANKYLISEFIIGDEHE